jgi:O-antigen/teichoic acid export membrane protein
MDSTRKYVAKSFGWGVAARIANALIQFISVPLLLNYFGKDNFGLITLAVSINAYLQLLDMGVNIGAVKYFSEWIGLKDFDLLDSVARTSITFYGIIGIINAILLTVVAIWGMHLFKVTSEQAIVLRNLFLILAVFAVANWCSSVFSQLLTANEEIYYSQQLNIIKNILGFLLILITINSDLGLTTYFLWLTLLNSALIIPLYIHTKKKLLIKSFLPASDWLNFGIVFKYSLAIIAMGVFQMSASQLRPVILSMFSSNGIGILSDYRVMETISLFIISIGGMFISIFLPKTSKLILDDNKKNIENFAYRATLYTSIICILLAMPFILNVNEILKIYVGNKYNYLNPWLITWIFTVLVYLHNSPVASLVLSTGKTKMLVYSSAIASVISLMLNAITCSSLGVGSAVLGYAIYILIQMSFYYFYFNKEVLHLRSWLVFKSFFIPTLLGCLALLVVYLLNIHLMNLILQITIKTMIWFILFIGLLIVSKVLNIQHLRGILQSLKQ